METIKPEDFKVEDSQHFFDALHSYAVTYANTNFRFDVTYSHGYKDVMALDEALGKIHEGLKEGKLVLVEGGEKSTLFALLNFEDRLFALQIPRTFPEIQEQGAISSVLKDYSIRAVQGKGTGEIRIMGTPVGSRRRLEQLNIMQGNRIFGVMHAPFPPNRNTNYYNKSTRPQ